MGLFSDPTFWVAVSFFGFLALILYYKVPHKAGEALDKRAEQIQNELEEARKLREEAQAILADYERKQLEAEQSAEEIVTHARKEAETLAEETRQSLKESLERRTRLAEEKIARAEAQAMSEVRAAAVDVAVSAAGKLISTKLDAKIADGLIDQTIQDIKSKLN